MTDKPTISSDIDGNIFVISGTASKALKRAGLKKEAAAMADEVWAAGSYDEALRTVMKYVDFE